MKKLLTLLFAFSFVFGYAQKFPVNRGDTTVMVRDAYLQAYRQFILPVVNDTTLNRGNDSLGSMEFRKIDSSVYVRNVNAFGTHYWQKFLSGTTTSVTSFNGRIGAVLPLTGDYTAAMVTNAVNTLGGYFNPTWITGISWSVINGTPTTVAGYGIVDAVTLTGMQTLTNKTLTNPIINVGGDQTGDIYYRSSIASFARLGIGSTGQVLQVVAGLPSWQTLSTTNQLFAQSDVITSQDRSFNANSHVFSIYGLNRWNFGMNQGDTVYVRDTTDNAQIYFSNYHYSSSSGGGAIGFGIPASDWLVIRGDTSHAEFTWSSGASQGQLYFQGGVSSLEVTSQFFLNSGASFYSYDGNAPPKINAIDTTGYNLQMFDSNGRWYTPTWSSLQTFIDKNIYNSDGTLLASRTLIGAGFDLNFTGLGNFSMDAAHDIFIDGTDGKEFLNVSEDQNQAEIGAGSNSTPTRSTSVTAYGDSLDFYVQNTAGITRMKIFDDSITFASLHGRYNIYNIPTGTAVYNMGVDASHHIVQSTSGGLPSLTNDNIWIGNGSNVATANVLSGDITMTNAGVVTIANSAVTNAKIANGTIDLTAKVTGILPIANGGTNVSSVTTAPTATAFAGWDANLNLSANNFIQGYATTATAAGTTTLTVSSAGTQYFTGTTTQTVKLPVVTTLVNGQQFVITNVGTGNVTVQSSGSNTLQAMVQNTQLVATVINTGGGTGTASWSWTYLNTSAGGSGVVSVSGTTNRITVSGTTAVTVDISASYVGQSSITTLGTITTGVWNGTAIANGNLANSSLTVNGVSISLGGSGTVTAAAGTLTGTTLNSTVVTSSLTSVGTITSGTWTGTTIAIANGGTGVTSVTTAPGATVWAGWDANKNFSANNFLQGYTTTATAAATTTLTVSSAGTQYFTGSTTQTVQMPVVTTLVNGQQYTITNLSTGVVTVQTSGANTMQSMASNSQLIATVTNTGGGTGTASWSWTYVNTSPTGSGVSQISNSDGTLTISPTTGAAVASIALAHANIWTAVTTINLTALGTTVTDGIVAENTTAAANNAQQVSSAINWVGAVWNTTTPASNTYAVKSYLLPVQGSSTTLAAYLQFTDYVGGTVSPYLGAAIKFGGVSSSTPMTGWLIVGPNSTTEYGGIEGNVSTGEIRIGGLNNGGYFPTFYSNNAEVARFTTGGHLLIGTTTDNSGLTINTSLAEKYTSTATSITLGASNTILEVTATGQTETLPTAASVSGRIYTIKLTASGTCTVNTTSSQTIDGSTTYSLSAQYKYVTVTSNGSNWIIIANN